MSINIDDNIKRQVSEMLKHMEQVVLAKLFLAEDRCLTCSETKEIMKIIAELAPEGKLKIEEYRKEKDATVFSEYGIINYPAIILEGESVKGQVKLTGIPSGYEFGTLIEDLLDISTGKVTLKEESLKKIERIDKRLLLQVFITPTCPYCPQAVRLAHKAAMANPHIVGEMVEATEFPELSQKYYVMGVPKTVILQDDKLLVEFEGAYPEDGFVSKLLDAYKKAK
ncbi:MAG: protein disulfide oxidoreductase [Candidatus Heimdallarchaeaceae archaeon]